jgi:hypothetical protein
MTEYFKGDKYFCIAHYGLLKDKVEKEFELYGDALCFKIEHNRKGANVQISRHFWEEKYVDAGWFPTSEGRI